MNAPIFLTARSFNHQNSLALHFSGRKGFFEFSQTSSDEFLVNLGYFPAYDRSAIPESLQGNLDERREFSGWNIKNESRFFFPSGRQELPAGFSFRWRESEKQKLMSGQPGYGKGGNDCRGARNRNDGHGCSQGLLDEPEAGIGDSRSSRVRDKGHIPAGQEMPHDFGNSFPFLGLVIAEQRLFDSVTVQDLDRLTGVLASDDRRLSQHADASQGQVFEVADGRGDDIQRPGHAIGPNRRDRGNRGRSCGRRSWRWEAGSA